METHLKAYLKTQDQEALHRFRVQVKKIKALLTLSGKGNPHAKLNPRFKPVKKVFSKAGELRNAYISGQLALQQRQPTSKPARKFRARGTKYLKAIRMARRPIKKKLSPIHLNTLRQFYESQLQRIAAGLEGQPSAEQLHNCRKRIKILLYNYPLVQGELTFELDTAYLDSLQETIGNWHDQWIAGKFADKPLPPTSLFAPNFYQRAIRQPNQIISHPNHDMAPTTI